MCSAQHWCATGQSLPCAAGQIAPTAGYDFCIACPEGSFQSLKGQTACLPCLRGHYCSGLGAAAAQPCAKGTFSSVEGLKHAANCTPAPPGYVSTKGSALPAACGGPSLFCPGGEGEPRTVVDGHETFTDATLLHAPTDLDDVTTRTSERLCAEGFFCQAGLSVYCPLGELNQKRKLRS